jgi:hypothetical protein
VSRITASQEDARIESIYRAAEHRAETLRGGLPAHAKADALRPIAESSLAREAAIESERHLVRKRFLPDELSSEWAWTMLLDVFVNEQHASGIKLFDLASKHGHSQLTAARQVAALIEYGLVKRTPKNKEIKESNVVTTAIGRQIIYDVFRYFDKIF